jgi:hypothetical protein
MGFLNKIFGPSKATIWKKIATDIGGEYIDGGFWGKGVLMYKHNNWELYLDTYTQSTGKSSTTYTRLRVPFVTKNNIRFSIYREGFFSKIGKFFGMQDIITGDIEFDKKFIIKGNDEFKIKHLLGDQSLKRLFYSIKSVNASVKDNEGWFTKKYPENVDLLYFNTIGIIKDKDTLKNLFELFGTLLDRMVDINFADSESPNFNVK